MEEKLFCRHCGKLIDSDSQFCQHCGGKVSNTNEYETASNNKDTHAEIQEEIPQVGTIVTTKGGMSLLSIFLWSLAICAICTIGYAAIRSEDAKPYDRTHYWGSSAYDTKGILFGDDYGDQLTWMRKDGYKKGIKNMALYSFPISFGILVVVALVWKSGNKQ